MDKKINRFCKLVLQINKLNKKLDKEYADFYSAGYTFEECFSCEIKELDDAQKELKSLLKEIISE